MHESGMDPRRKQVRGPARGIAQWEKPRYAQLKAFARGTRQSPRSLTAQLGFVWYELKTTYSRALTNLKKTTTTKQATFVFMDQYEQPSAEHFSRRETYAGAVKKVAWQQKW